MVEKVLVTSDREKYSISPNFEEDKSKEANDFKSLQKFLRLSNLNGVLYESESLDVLIIGELVGSDITDSLIGVKLGEMSKSIVNGVDDFVVYSAKKEGIDVTIWNMQRLPYEVTESQDHIEIKKILDRVDIKILYINYQKERSIFNVSAFDNLTEFLGKEFWKNTIVIINTHDCTDFDAVLRNAIPHQKQNPYKVGVRNYLIAQDMIPKSIATTIESTTIHGKFHSAHLSAFFFYLVESLSLPAKGALLKINMKRITSRKVDYSDSGQQCIHFGFLQNTLSAELRLPKTTVDFSGSVTARQINSGHGAMVTPASLSATPPPLNDQCTTKSTENIKELTHFYTATHDLQFGAHGKDIGSTNSC